MTTLVLLSMAIGKLAANIACIVYAYDYDIIKFVKFIANQPLVVGLLIFADVNASLMSTVSSLALGKPLGEFLFR